MNAAEVQALVARITASLPGLEVSFLVAPDVKRPIDGRLFIQCTYHAPCTVSGTVKLWKGRKWYLSDHMTEDEVVKTCYAAFRMAIEHEVMEGFKIDGRRVFNPHTPWQVLMEAAQHEQFREPPV